MAIDADAVTQQSKTTYKLFCRLIIAATLTVLAILGLMAIFLV
jgi:hypothetical protein